MSYFENIEATNEYTVSMVPKLIPDNTTLEVAIASAEWTEPTDFKGVTAKIGLHVVTPGEFKDALVFDNLKIGDSDEKKRSKALTKLLTYDTLCKGVLAKADAAGKEIEGDNNLLERALLGGSLIATFNVWELPVPKRDKSGEMETITGNWVSSIKPLPKKVREENKNVEKQAKSKNQVDADIDFDDSIPF
jgi:hypothetical protein